MASRRSHDSATVRAERHPRVRHTRVRRVACQAHACRGSGAHSLTHLRRCSDRPATIPERRHRVSWSAKAGYRPVGSCARARRRPRSWLPVIPTVTACRSIGDDASWPPSPKSAILGHAVTTAHGFRDQVAACSFAAPSAQVSTVSET